MIFEIKNGDIIKFNNDNVRCWVAIHISKLDKFMFKINKNVKDNTEFYLFGGLWYEGDCLTGEPYGKCVGNLRRGMFNNISIVGNIANKEDYLKYKTNEMF